MVVKEKLHYSFGEEEEVRREARSFHMSIRLLIEMGLSESRILSLAGQSHGNQFDGIPF